MLLSDCFGGNISITTGQARIPSWQLRIPLSTTVPLVRSVPLYLRMASTPVHAYIPLVTLPPVTLVRLVLDISLTYPYHPFAPLSIPKTPLHPHAPAAFPCTRLTRSIVSQTDNWVLLFSQSQAAYVASVGVPLLLGPILACMYATVATAAFVLDSLVPPWWSPLNPIKVFGIRTELLNNIKNAIFGWERRCIKTEIGGCDHGEKKKLALLGYILTIRCYWGLVVLMLYYKG